MAMRLYGWNMRVVVLYFSIFMGYYTHNLQRRRFPFIINIRLIGYAQKEHLAAVYRFLPPKSPQVGTLRPCFYNVFISQLIIYFRGDLV